MLSLCTSAGNLPLVSVGGGALYLASVFHALALRRRHLTSRRGGAPRTLCQASRTCVPCWHTTFSNTASRLTALPEQTMEKGQRHRQQGNGEAHQLLVKGRIGARRPMFCSFFCDRHISEVILKPFNWAIMSLLTEEAQDPKFLSLFHGPFCSLDNQVWLLLKEAIATYFWGQNLVLRSEIKQKWATVLRGSWYKSDEL